MTLIERMPKKAKIQREKKLENLLRYKNRFIDFGILALLSLVAVLFLFFILRKSEYVQITLRVTSSDSLRDHDYNRTPQWYVEALQPGRSSKDLLGRPTVTVEDIYYYQTFTNSDTVFVVLTIKSIYNSNTNEYSYNGNRLAVGQFTDFTVDGILVEGVVQKIGSDQIKEADQVEQRTSYTITGEFEFIHNEKKEEYTVEYEGIRPYFHSGIETGITLKDSKGRTYVEITDVQKKPAYKKFPYQGAVVTVLDPDRMRVSARAEVAADMINSEPYFAGVHPLRKGEIIPFYFDDFTAYFTIYDLELVTK